MADTMAKEQKPKRSESSASKKRRNTIQLTLDDKTEERVKRFLSLQRVEPDRAAVAMKALLEFLDREEKRDHG